MYHHDDCYNDLSTYDIWVLLTLGNYALYKLTEKYENKISCPTLHNFVYDRRGCPKVRKYLVSKGLIKNTFWNDTDLNFVEEEVEKLLPGSMKEPEFNTSGYIKETEYDLSNKKATPITNIGDIYRNLYDLNAYEIIYVYLHQDKYDFRIFSTKTITRNEKKHTTHENMRHELKIYPVDAIKDAGSASLIAAGETYSKAHACEVLTATFGIKFRALDDSKDFLTLEAIHNRVEKVEEKLRLLRRTCAELKVLRRKAAKMGDEALSKIVIETGLKYVRRSAPLWLNSDDREKKNLAILLCKGAYVITEKTVRKTISSSGYMY
jgi:hypothetical protein